MPRDAMPPDTIRRDTIRRDTARRSGALRSTLLAPLLAVAVLAGVALSPVDAPVVEAAGIADDDWTGIVNAYRAMSGLAPVTANSTWSAQAAAHSCYMLENGMSHDEIPGRPGYTSGGDVAGNSGNVAVHPDPAATARDHIDLWMAAPFHAIGILRPNLVTSGFGSCSRTSTSTSWRSGATLDVVRGIDRDRSAPSTPVVFPGDGATIALDRFRSETPDPVAACGWTGGAGLPLVVLMPADVSSARATLTGPDGPIETCTLHAGNLGDPTARSIVAGANAVIVMPRTVLSGGGYRASVSSDGGDVAWSFRVDPSAALTMPAPQTAPTGSRSRFDAVAPFRLVDSRAATGATRLEAGTTTRIAVGDASVTAVSANFVAVHPRANGYLTAFNCSAPRPVASTLNYRAGSVVANQTIVPVENASICVYTRATTEIVIDVNGYYRSGSTSHDGFHAVTPVRVLDSRTTASLRAGRTTRVRVTGVSGRAPAGATAVALNVTAIRAAQGGWLKVAPCGSAGDATISSLNYARGEVRPNSVVVPVGSQGSVCVTSLRDIDVTIDLTGYFAARGGLAFQPLAPVRLFDSRSPYESMNDQTGGSRLGAGQVIRLQVAGRRGIPADAAAASVNIAATDPLQRTYLTAYPCGERPTTANVNVSPAQKTVTNGAMVKLSGSGELCIYARAAVHVIVDINGVWR